MVVGLGGMQMTLGKIRLGGPVPTDMNSDLPEGPSSCLSESQVKSPHITVQLKLITFIKTNVSFLMLSKI